MIRKGWFFFLALILLLTGCRGQVVQNAAVTSDPNWPTRGWQVSTPAEQGMDPALLDKMQAEISARKIGLDSLLIIRHGKIVSETYYNRQNKSTRHELYSVTKSFTSTLVGIALDQGKLPGIDKQVGDLLPGREFEEMDDRKASMTLENLLTMTSGLDWSEGDATYAQMYRSTDWVDMVMGLPMDAAPGEKFVYCSGCSHVISAVVQQATGSTLDFATKNLFTPLGIDARWETDRKGIPIGGWGLQLTPRDMAKLGYLFLHQGQWEGRQVVSSDWVKKATTKHTPADGTLGYGYQWWIYPNHDAYTALGRYGQTIFVAPGLDMVIVTTAQIEEGHDPIFALIDNYILPAAEKK